MKNHKTAKLVAFISFTLLFTFLFTSVAVAVDSSVGQGVKNQQTTENKSTTTSVQVKDRTRLRACQAKQAAIKTRSLNVVQRGIKTFNRFDRIVERVKQYYTKRLLPKGVTIENYDQMLADIAAKKEAVKTAWAKAEATAKGFSCESGDPKDQVRQFRAEMTEAIRAMKEYKRAVINFLVAVRTKAKNIKTATGSATPSAR